MEAANHYRYVGTAHAEPEGLGSDANIDLRMGMLYTHQRGRDRTKALSRHTRGRNAKQVAASWLATQSTQPNHLQGMYTKMYDQKLPLLCCRQREASAPM